MESKTLAIIDIDSLYYMSCKETAEESIAEFDKKFLGILEYIKADFYAAFNSKSYYFRHEIFKDYKGNRVRSTSLKWVSLLKSYSEVKFNVKTVKMIEADDLVAYWANNAPEIYAESDGNTVKTYKLDIVVVSADKDVLMLPHKTFDFKHWTYQNVSERTSLEFFMYQMLCGDSADNVLGCAKRIPHVYKTGPLAGETYMKRVGVTPKKAESFIEAYKDAKDELLLPRVLQFYIEELGEQKGVLEFSQNYRLLRMLSSDEEFINEGLTPPSNLEIFEVSPLFNVEEDDF